MVPVLRWSTRVLSAVALGLLAFLYARWFVDSRDVLAAVGLVVLSVAVALALQWLWAPGGLAAWDDERDEASSRVRPAATPPPRFVSPRASGGAPSAQAAYRFTPSSTASGVGAPPAAPAWRAPDTPPTPTWRSPTPAPAPTQVRPTPLPPPAEKAPPAAVPGPRYGPPEPLPDPNAPLWSRRPGPTPSTPVSVNHATIAELARIPGLGHDDAERLVHERELGGSFDSLDDLARVPGFTPERIRALERDLTL